MRTVNSPQNIYALLLSFFNSEKTILGKVGDAIMGSHKSNSKDSYKNAFGFIYNISEGTAGRSVPVEDICTT